jgi:hypothetical protein
MTLTLTFRNLPVAENQFLKTWRRILRGKGDSGLSYCGIDEIPVSHLPETEKKLRKINLIRRSYLINFSAAENSFIDLL